LVVIVVAWMIFLPGRSTAQSGLPDPVVLGPSLDQRTWIVDGWRYHPGDDPAWADLELDDSSWPIADSTLIDPDSMPGGWPGVGWFRRRVTLAEGMPTTALAVRVEQHGASELYLDGQLIVTAGVVSSDPELERPVYPNDFAGVALERGVVHVLAVRYSNARGNRDSAGYRGFQVNLRSVESAANAYHSWMRGVSVRQMASAGAFGALALLHLLLFVFHRRDRSNLVIAAFTAFTAVQLLTEYRFEEVTDLLERLELYRFFTASYVAAILAGLAVEHVIFRKRPQPSTFLVGVLGITLVGWVWTWDAFRPGTALLLFSFAGAVEMLRVAVSAMFRRDPDAWIIAAGFVPLAGVPIINGLMVSISAPALFHLPLTVGFLPLVLCFSVYRSRRTARTSRELEARLDEVRRLSELNVAQERRAALDEAERRLLAAENRRRAEELEAARALQLSMIPSCPPEIEALDISFRMVTATEVGGDYVDFRPDGRTRSLVAVGDATSHGLQAGMVVAAVKSMFQAAPPDDAPRHILSRIDAELGAMRERYASMAMAVLSFDGTRFHVSSAGMPPLLVLRQATGAVEEIMLAAPPLGTVSRTGYEERAVELAPGDTVVVMTDGLAEAVDPGGDLFGYDRTMECVATMYGRTAGGVVEGIFDAVTEFLGGQPPRDDITVVAVRVAPSEPWLREPEDHQS